VNCADSARCSTTPMPACPTTCASGRDPCIETDTTARCREESTVGFPREDDARCRPGAHADSPVNPASAVPTQQLPNRGGQGRG
jgi:hypothetical protein